VARPRAHPIPYSVPKKSEPTRRCVGCKKPWAADLMVLSLHRCRNCAREWWREAQAAHRSGQPAPALRPAIARSELPADVDAFLANLCAGSETQRRRMPVRSEGKHSPEESIDSIVARMDGDFTDMPLLPAPRKRDAKRGSAAPRRSRRRMRSVLQEGSV